MRKILIALLVLVLTFAFVSCDDGKNVPEEATVSTWDGTVVTSWYKEGTKEYTLTEASQLAGLAELVNKGTTFSGVTINLGIDIDLSNKEWTPIGQYKTKDGGKEDGTKKTFSGTFDGKNHTISGLKITYDEGKSSYLALFGYADGEVKNFTVEGEVKACDSSGVVAALGDGGKLENIISKVNVSVSKATGEKKAKVAGIVVAVKDGNKGCTIKNCTNSGKISSTATDANDAIGGIVAWSKLKSLTIEGCKNEGDVSTTSTTQYAGGILGAVEKSETLTTIKNCTNTGNVTSGKTDNGAGAIIGNIYSGAKGQITGCTPSDNQVGNGSFTTNT